MEIKAIETQYKGYRFRSRLEARWAVFFDALGVEWEYESEGFELPDGTWYLPDFFIPKIEEGNGSYVEVKPYQPGAFEIKKCKELAHYKGIDAWIVYGLPGKGGCISFRVEYQHEGGERCYFGDGDGYAVTVSENDTLDAEYLEAIKFPDIPPMVLADPYFKAYQVECNVWYTEACKAASMARFEHGENAAESKNPTYYYDPNTGNWKTIGNKSGKIPF